MSDEEKTRYPLLGMQARPDSDAPQVVEPYEAPIALGGESEGLQPVSHRFQKTEAYHSHPDSPPHHKAPQQRKRASWPWILGTVSAALAGLGAGIGTGYAVGDNAHGGDGAAPSR